MFIKGESTVELIIYNDLYMYTQKPDQFRWLVYSFAASDEFPFWSQSFSNIYSLLFRFSFVFLSLSTPKEYSFLTSYGLRKCIKITHKTASFNIKVITMRFPIKTTTATSNRTMLWPEIDTKNKPPLFVCICKIHTIIYCAKIRKVFVYQVWLAQCSSWSFNEISILFGCESPELKLVAFYSVFLSSDFLWSINIFYLLFTNFWGFNMNDK